MKRFFTATLTILLTAGLASAIGFDVPPTIQMGNEIGNMQNTNNQMRLIEQQRFRKDEYNDYKEDNIQEVKAKKAREYKQYQGVNEKIYTPNQNMDFVNENGRIILKSIQ